MEVGGQSWELMRSNTHGCASGNSTPDGRKRTTKPLEIYKRVAIGFDRLVVLDGGVIEVAFFRPRLPAGARFASSSRR